LNNNQIIALNGGKNRKKGGDDNGGKDDVARLIIDGEEYELGSFVLSGESPDGKRLLFTWDCRNKKRNVA